MSACIICLEHLETDDQQVLQLVPCLHLAHTSCVLIWFKFGNNDEVCPFCKLDIFDAEIFKEGEYQMPAIYYQ